MTRTVRDMTVMRSGFPWDDTQWRFLAVTDDWQWFAYGPTPEAATDSLAELTGDTP